MIDKNYNTFVDLVRDRSQTTPDKRIFTFLESEAEETGALTYSELDVQARSIANTLLSNGYQNKSVLLVFQPGLDFISGFIGCLYAGVRAVPVHPPTQRHLDRLKAVVNASQACAILTTSRLELRLKYWIESQELKINPNIGLHSVDCIENEADLWRDQGVSGDDLAFLQFTSGSTGNPKGVMVSHGNILHNIDLINSIKTVTDQMVNVSWLPQFHDMGLIDGILANLASDKPTYLMSPATFSKRPLNWLKAMEKFRGTHSGGPCFAFEYCIRTISDELKENLDLSSWEFAYCGAEPIQKSVMDNFSRAFYDCGFRSKFLRPCYGMAESTLMISLSEVNGDANSDLNSLRLDNKALSENRVVLADDSPNASSDIVSCGKLVTAENQNDPNDWAIVDPSSLNALDDKLVGEVWLKGGSIAKGYWGNEELTQKQFDAYCVNSVGVKLGPYLRTGDLGFVFEEQLYITGRIKDVIIIRGANYYPQDIECIAYSSGPLMNSHSCAAFSTNVDGVDKLIVVQELVKVAPDADFSTLESSIKNQIASELGLSVFDVAFIKYGSINKTSSGKIQRHKVKERYLNEALNRLNEMTTTAESFDEKNTQRMACNTIMPANSDELKLERKIRNTLVFCVSNACDLDVGSVDPQENFVAMGLDSILVTEMIVEVEKLIESYLPDETIFEYQTINDLVAYALEFKRSHVNSISSAKLESVKIIADIKKSNSEGKVFLPESELV